MIINTTSYLLNAIPHSSRQSWKYQYSTLCWDSYTLCQARNTRIEEAIIRSQARNTITMMLVKLYEETQTSIHWMLGMHVNNVIVTKLKQPMDASVVCSKFKWSTDSSRGCKAECLDHHFHSSTRALVTTSHYALHWHSFLLPCTTQHWLPWLAATCYAWQN